MRRTAGIACMLVGVVVVAGGGWLFCRHWHSHRPKGLVYVSNGFGGFVAPTPKPNRPDAPMLPAMDAYNAGRYYEAENDATAIVQAKANATAPSERTVAARAEYVLAFSAARRKDFRLARERFNRLRKQAGGLPDHGKSQAEIEQNQPTLEEEGAYQYAVCTEALGDKKASEREHLAFMRRYPESPLVHAAVLRIGRFHGGNIPPAAEAIWKEAMAKARALAEAKQREHSMCAPECLAEMLRRRDEPTDVHDLAKEMCTSAEGTTLAALATAAKKRGFAARGLALTAKGLARQKLPVIALLTPGHFVLLESFTPTGVTIWDPSVGGVGKGARHNMTTAQWNEAWHGITLALR